MTTAVQMEDVVKRYGDQTAVDHLSLDIRQGSVVALLGPNGAGKTTAVSLMLGLRKPTSGTVRLLGGDPAQPSTRERVGAMLQQVNLPEKLSVYETLNLFRSYYEHPLPASRLLELAGLEQERKRPANRLSGGQQRRLQFALAMTGDPQVLFLDEPTTGMDIASRRLFWERLHALGREGNRTILLTTHHLEEADASAHRIVVIQRGRSVADGTPAELKALAGFRYISFTPEAGMDPLQLQDLPGIVKVDWNGHRVRLQTQNSDQVLYTLLARHHHLSDIEVSSGGLEDAFISLTEDETKEEAAP